LDDLAAERKATKQRQDGFANRIVMHRAHYSAIERSEKNITLDTLRRVADGKTDD
jgi:transcriptional regulator with XRE-family HTH domain